MSTAYTYTYTPRSTVVRGVPDVLPNLALGSLTALVGVLVPSPGGKA